MIVLPHRRLQLRIHKRLIRYRHLVHISPRIIHAVASRRKLTLRNTLLEWLPNRLRSIRKQMLCFRLH